MLKELIRENRSRRRFYQEHAIGHETLTDLIDLARLSPSAANLQPLRHIISCDPKINEQIFSCLGWAAYIKDWPGPKEGERPSAYIVVMQDSHLSNDYIAYDCGIAAQSILLGAVEKGLGGCMIASVNRKKLAAIIDAPSEYKILLVIALGRSRETALIEEMDADGNVRYWRDETGVHHVPKRNIEDIITRSYVP